MCQQANFTQRSSTTEALSSMISFDGIASFHTQTYSKHDAMFNVEKNFFLFPVVPDEGVQCVTMRHPANQA